MRNPKVRSSPWRTLALLAVAGVAGLVLLAGGLGYLHVAGYIDLPFLPRPRPMYVPQEGMVAVPLLARDVPPYTKITREFVLDKSGNPPVSYLHADEAERRGFMTDVREFMGRVSARELKAGYALKPDDLLPKGSRPGAPGGTPPGKRAMVLDASKIIGVYALRAGDRFDLIASVTVEPAKSQQGGAVTVVGGPAAHEPKKRVVVKPLVQNGVVVLPVAYRAHLPGTPRKMLEKPGPAELVVAVAPDEVAPLTAAMAMGAEIVAAYRSGQPEDSVQGAALTPGTPPPAKPVMVEVIHKGKREVLSFPGAAAPPVSQPEPPSTVSPAVATRAVDRTPARR